MPEAEAALRRGDAALIVCVPAGAEEAVKRGKSTTVQTLANGAQLLLSKVAYRAVATTVFTVSAGVQVKRFEASGLLPRDAMARALPVHTEIRAPGNFWYDYALYLAPGMMFSILQMSACFSTLWLFRQHREHAATIVAPRRGERTAFLVGRLLPLFAANAAAVVALFLVAFPLAGLPPSPVWPQLLWRALAFTIVCMGMGALLSALFTNQVTAAQIGLLINAPAFVFSGYTFPRWAMPDAVRMVAEGIPLTHLLDGFVPMLVFGTASSAGLWPLALFALFFWGGALALVSRRGQRARARGGALLRHLLHLPIEAGAAAEERP
jgi:ABC-2 type transport system permease protein